jgi:hypothetical protein
MSMWRIFLCILYGLCLMMLSVIFVGACEAHDPAAAFWIVVCVFIPPAAVLLSDWPDIEWRRKVKRVFLALPPQERLAVHMNWSGRAQYSPKMLTQPSKEWLEPDSIDLKNWGLHEEDDVRLFVR